MSQNQSNKILIDEDAFKRVPSGNNAGPGAGHGNGPVNFLNRDPCGIASQS